MRLPSVGQTYWQSLWSQKRWLRRTWGLKSENFYWKSLPRQSYKIKKISIRSSEREVTAQEGRCTFRIPLKTKQCFSVWTATSEDLTLWHRMKTYMFQELSCKVFFPRKYQFDEPVCPEQVHFYSRGWILDEQSLMFTQPTDYFSMLFIPGDTGDIAGYDLEPCQKITGTRVESARVLWVPGAFTHNIYTAGSKVYKGSVQSTAWVCMGEKGTEAKAEGEVQAVVIVRLTWNHPVIYSQEEENENGFKLAGKALGWCCQGSLSL